MQEVLSGAYDGRQGRIYREAYQAIALGPTPPGAPKDSNQKFSVGKVPECFVTKKNNQGKFKNVFLELLSF